MKKILTLAIILGLFTTGLSAEKNLISFSAGLSTGIPIYNSENITNNTSEWESSTRLVIGTFAYVNLNLIEYASIYSGVNFLSDFNWTENDLYANHLHLDFPLGLRLSPGLEGFSFGTAYLLGFRSDFYNNLDDEKSSSITAWGNGFQFFAEYDFSYHGSTFLPLVGISWGLIPRGNYEYDNLLNLYLGITF